ncbi:MAG: exopolysaccharide biosynthesis protein [Xanthomonadales bacterium]|nr:exopolysaccharide biosynthesis protein [Xanthomonadales bacterium]
MGKMKPCNETESEPVGAGVAPGRDDMRRAGSGLEDLLERIRRIDGDHDPVDLEAVLVHVGRRSFGGIVLFAGIIVLAPLVGDIPGVPTLAALLVAITAVQLLVGRRYFWLPRVLLQRSISRQRLETALDTLQRPARVADRLIRRRLEVFISPVATRVIAAASLCVALVMPVLELIPFSANLAGVALFAFGISLIARDGLFALISLVVSPVALGLVGWWLIGQ